MAAAADTFVIWARCADDAYVPQIAALEDRLRADGDPIRVHCTLPGDHPTHPRDIRERLGRPDLILWLGGELHAQTLRLCETDRVPVVLIGADERTVASLPGPWFRARRRALSQLLHHVYVKDADVLTAFRRAGIEIRRLSVSDGMEERIAVPGYNDKEFRQMTQTIGTRPLWLAADVTLDETPLLIAAQRVAARRSHRLLLILNPRHAADGPRIAASLAEAGLDLALRSDGQDPEDATQVYVADIEDELGLWLRMAGISYLGGSFGADTLLDPFVPASLGSVLIHGPQPGARAARLDRLERAGATWRIAQPDDLGGAVESLLSVGEAADRATIGWDVVSRGAEMTDAVAGMIRDLYDSRTPA